MNIDKKAHDKALREVGLEFRLIDCSRKAHENAIIGYNGGGEGNGNFNTGVIKLSKIRDMSPFVKNDDDDSAEDSIVWFEGIIRQYLNQYMICDKIFYTKDYIGGRMDVDIEFTVFFKILIP